MCYQQGLPRIVSRNIHCQAIVEIAQCMLSTLLKHGIVIIIQVITFCVVLAANQISAKPALSTKYKVYRTLQAIHTVHCTTLHPAAQHFTIHMAECGLFSPHCTAQSTMHVAFCTLKKGVTVTGYLCIVGAPPIIPLATIRDDRFITNIFIYKKSN